MSKTKFAAALVALICCTCASAAPALAADEFSGVGNKTTIKAEESIFHLGEIPITCAIKSGSGNVASSTKLNVEVSYEKCKAPAFLVAKIATCDMSYNPEGLMSITGGCKITVGECEVTFPSASNKQLKGADYFVTNETKGSLESEIYETIEGITYEASIGCKSFAIKGGKEGELDTDPSYVQGVAVNNTHPFVVGGAGQRKLRLENENTFSWHLAVAKFLACTSVVFGASTEGDLIPGGGIKFKSLSFTGCTSNLFNSGEAAKMEAVPGTECSYYFGVASGVPAVLPPQPGFVFLREKACEIKAKVNTCTIKLKGGVPQLAHNELENLATTPKKVKVTFFVVRSKFVYTTEGACNGLVGGEWFFSGEARIKAEMNAGIGVDVSFQ